MVPHLIRKRRFIRKILNDCIDAGMKFSIATARMPYGRTFEIKRIVTGVIAGCNEDGVAQFLRKEYEQKLR